MTALLLANVASTLFMVGLTWFVQVVHYPLFPLVPEDGFPEYHQQHSNRTTYVVLPPMLIEIVTSFALLTDPPGNAQALVITGAGLAAATWLLTALAAAPAHGRIGRQGLDSQLHGRLLRISWARTLVWTAHGGVVLALLAAV